MSKESKDEAIPSLNPNVSQIREARQKRDSLPLELEDGTFEHPPYYNKKLNNKAKELFIARYGKEPNSSELSDYVISGLEEEDFHKEASNLLSKL